MLRKFITVLLMTIVGITLSKCALAESLQEGRIQNDDCLSCHSLNNSLGIRDFSNFYGGKKELHRIGAGYPLEIIANENFNVPNTQCSELVFFDSNKNGQPDVDEVRVYEINGVPTVTCASCHREHERSVDVVDKSSERYLRGTLVASDLCVACHRK